jgi:hypothetical protein
MRAWTLPLERTSHSRRMARDNARFGRKRVSGLSGRTWRIFNTLGWAATQSRRYALALSQAASSTNCSVKLSRQAVYSLVEMS